MFFPRDCCDIMVDQSAVSTTVIQTGLIKPVKISLPAVDVVLDHVGFHPVLGFLEAQSGLGAEFLDGIDL